MTWRPENPGLRWSRATDGGETATESRFRRACAVSEGRQTMTHRRTTLALQMRTGRSAVQVRCIRRHWPKKPFIGVSKSSVPSDRSHWHALWRRDRSRLGSARLARRGVDGIVSLRETPREKVGGDASGNHTLHLRNPHRPASRPRRADRSRSSHPPCPTDRTLFSNFGDVRRTTGRVHRTGRGGRAGRRPPATSGAPLRAAFLLRRARGDRSGTSIHL